MAIFLSVVASMMILMDHNTRGTRQDNIKHVPKIRTIALLSMANVACVVFFTLGLSVSLYQQHPKPGSI
jgi:hypothetical protein